MRKRKELETENEELKRQLLAKESECSWLKTNLDIINAYTEEYPIPENCTNGPWCKTCAFVKLFRVNTSYTDTTKLYICGKSEVCKGYVPKTEV